MYTKLVTQLRDICSGHISFDIKEALQEAEAI